MRIHFANLREPAGTKRQSRRYGMLLGLVAAFLSMALLAAKRPEEILVKTGTHTANTVRVDAELNGKRAELECVLSQRDCRIPNEGRYILVHLPTEESNYTDCPNVDLYEQLPDHKQGEKVGEYCLLVE